MEKDLLRLVLKIGSKHFLDKNTEKILKEAHPLQFIPMLDTKPFMFYQAKYEYTTIRGNRKNGIKYFVFNSYSPEIDIPQKLEEWVKLFNKENPNRKLSNVKFLESQCLGYITL